MPLGMAGVHKGSAPKVSLRMPRASVPIRDDPNTLCTPFTALSPTRIPEVTVEKWSAVQRAIFLAVFEASAWRRSCVSFPVSIFTGQDVAHKPSWAQVWLPK